MLRKLALLGWALALSASALMGQEVDPAIVRKLPAGAKVHLVTDDEFKNLLAKSPSAPSRGIESGLTRNPHGSTQGSPVMTDLAKQRQSADADLVKIRAGRSLGAASASAARVSVKTGPQAKLGTEKINAEQTAGSRYGRVQGSNTQINGCYALSNGQVTIGKVAGQSQALVFTPIPQYNLYTIHGCNFGDAKAGNKAWIYGPGFHADFTVEEWTDDSIAIKLGENISGVPDFDNLHLVVHRADGKEAQSDGFKFYAARERVLLKYIPPAWRKLDFNIYGLTQHFKHPYLQDNSPAGGPNVPSQAAGTSIFVTRRMADKFTPTSDSFDFSQLPRGWALDSATWTSYPATCPNVVTYREDFGHWNIQWNPSRIQFEWADTSCSGFWPNPVLGFPTSAYQNHTESSYALKVWVIGPRGMESQLPHM